MLSLGCQPEFMPLTPALVASSASTGPDSLSCFSASVPGWLALSVTVTVASVRSALGSCSISTVFSLPPSM